MNSFLFIPFFAVKHKLYKLTLESRCDLFQFKKCKCRSDFNYFLLLTSPPPDVVVVVNMFIVISLWNFFSPLHAHKNENHSISKRRAERKLQTHEWEEFFSDQFLHFLKCISRYIYVAAFGALYMHIVIIIFFFSSLFMGTDFFPSRKKAHTMHNGGRMMKILKLRSFILLTLSTRLGAFRSGANFLHTKFTFSRERENIIACGGNALLGSVG